MEILRTVHDLRQAVSKWRHPARTIGLVPTMGALHEGHLSLVRLAGVHCERVIATIFVNPTQFAASEDLSHYPRDEAGDAAKLESAGCHLLFAPDTSEMYPRRFATSITVGGVTEALEGAARPGHFAGVATIVAKLLLQARPDVAVFGEKDYQQLLVIKKLVHDLNIPVEIVAGETTREADGLAMSSRNAYLSAPDRAKAAQLSAVLRAGVAALEAGAAIADEEAKAADALRTAGFGPIDYVAVRDAHDLSALPGPHVDRPARILAAAKLGATRLIDNFAITPR
jgi:pantoate--beta-alanine ligase